ncbi:hypothetical protein [Azoarcus sp. DN11]|uniref:hypothetical protein n=1 Tax=Azoarcus sp. DN11 TaxID=356837 RepID=UPI00157F8328|nr:hypothetical protein [Azoarcus sp. DN11]
MRTAHFANVRALLEARAAENQDGVYCIAPETSHSLSFGALAESARALAAFSGALVLDVGTSAEYLRGHIPGAAFVLRSRLADALAAVPELQHFIVTRPTEIWRGSPPRTLPP